jgi:hypothetical protein
MRRLRELAAANPMCAVVIGPLPLPSSPRRPRVWQRICCFGCSMANRDEKIPDGRTGADKQAPGTSVSHAIAVLDGMAMADVCDH